MKITDWIQAVSSLTLVIVTIAYAVITNRMLHAPHRSFLKPMEVDLEDGSWKIRVNNFGPALAMNVKIKTILAISLGNNCNETQLTKTERIVVAEGPSEVHSGKDARYSFTSNEYTHFLKYPIEVSWQSLTGKKENGIWWLYTGGFGDEFIRVTLQKRLQFNLISFAITIKNLFSSKQHLGRDIT